MAGRVLNYKGEMYQLNNTFEFKLQKLIHMLYTDVMTTHRTRTLMFKELFDILQNEESLILLFQDVKNDVRKYYEDLTLNNNLDDLMFFKRVFSKYIDVSKKFIAPSCLMCLDAQPCILTTPCGHLASCKKCFKEFTRTDPLKPCYVCRSKVDEYKNMDTYVSQFNIQGEY